VATTALLAQWGALADTFGWSPAIYSMYRAIGAMGLVWWLEGRTVTALGPEHTGVGQPAYDVLLRDRLEQQHDRPAA
jgi:hypothetical protein